MNHQQIAKTYPTHLLQAIAADRTAAWQWRERWEAVCAELKRREKHSSCEIPR